LPTTRHHCILDCVGLGSKSRRWASLTVTPERVISEYIEDLIFVTCWILTHNKLIIKSTIEEMCFKCFLESSKVETCTKFSRQPIPNFTRFVRNSSFKTVTSLNFKTISCRSKIITQRNIHPKQLI